MIRPGDREILALFHDLAPELEVQLETPRSFDLESVMQAALQMVVFASSIGAFAGLWKVLQELIRRHSNALVVMRYVAEDGREVEIKYTALTRAEAEEMIACHPPAAQAAVKLIVHG